MTAIPQLNPEEPAASRTDTSSYHFPPATPSPPADRCTREQLLEIAADGARDPSELLCSPAHVRALCRLVGALGAELVAELQYSAELQRQLVRSDSENDALRRLTIAASFERLTITVTGRSYAEVAADLEQQVAGVGDPP
jgi:hypothetical protein